MWGRSKKRRYWGRNQVRTPNGIKAGRFYFLIYTVGQIWGEVVRVNSQPNKKGKVKADWHTEEDKVLNGDFYLQDCSILPYEGNDWNTANFVLRTKAKTVKGALLSFERKIEELKKKYKPHPPCPDSDHMDY